LGFSVGVAIVGFIVLSFRLAVPHIS